MHLIYVLDVFHSRSWYGFWTAHENWLQAINIWVNLSNQIFIFKSENSWINSVLLFCVLIIFTSILVTKSFACFSTVIDIYIKFLANRTELARLNKHKGKVRIQFYSWQKFVTLDDNWFCFEAFCLDFSMKLTSNSGFHSNRLLINR